jgi:sugar phosphate isomerase/epimerase
LIEDRPVPTLARMRIGCSTICFGPQTTEEALRRIAELGFTVVDVAAVPRFFEHVNLVDPPAGEVDRVAKLVHDHGFEVAGLQSVPWVPDALDDPDELRRRYTVAADAAVAVGARAWVVDAGSQAGIAERREGFDRFRRTIAMAAGLAEERGLRLAIEAPHKGTLAETLPQVLELLDVSGVPGLGIDLDTSHVLNSGSSTKEMLDALGGRIAHVALRDGHRGAGFCTPGDGEFDFAEFFDLLAATGYTGDATLELEPAREASADDRARDVARARTFLQPLVARAGLD